MKLRIGIVGPLDSIERIQKVGESYYGEELEFLPIQYEHIGEIERLIPQYAELYIDYWFFSGQAPYSYALEKNLVTEEESLYPPLAGSSLYRTMIRIVLEGKEKWENVSFDTLERDDVECAFEDAELKGSVYTFPYQGYLEPERIYNFHKGLFDQGKVNICLTCINAVYERLKKDGIPTYRLFPTQNIIKRMFPNLIRRAKSMAFQRSQISVVAVEVESKEWVSLKRKQSYEIKRKELKLEQYLIDFAEKASGSFVQIGDGLYFVFVTWGELEELEHTQELQSLPSTLLQLTGFHIHVGLGFGSTVHQAEQNARKALQYAYDKKEPSVMKVLQDGTVIEPIAEQQTIQFNTRHLNHVVEKKVQELKGEATISLSMIYKVHALCQHYKKNEITAQELAHWLQVTDRNARRILKELHTLTLVKEVGEEQPGARGRPRKVFHFQWPQESKSIKS
jgi:hypothetical protein